MVGALDHLVELKIDRAGAVQTVCGLPRKNFGKLKGRFFAVCWFGVTAFDQWRSGVSSWDGCGVHSLLINTGSQLGVSGLGGSVVEVSIQEIRCDLTTMPHTHPLPSTHTRGSSTGCPASATVGCFLL